MKKTLVFILVLSWCGLLKAERLEWRLGGAEGVGWEGVGAGVDLGPARGP